MSESVELVFTKGAHTMGMSVECSRNEQGAYVMDEKITKSFFYIVQRMEKALAKKEEMASKEIGHE